MHGPLFTLCPLGLPRPPGRPQTRPCLLLPPDAPDVPVDTATGVAQTTVVTNIFDKVLKEYGQVEIVDLSGPELTPGIEQANDIPTVDQATDG